MLEIIGWLGGFMLAICGAPQAWKSYKDGHSYGISWGFIGLWFWGEVFVLIYILPTGLLPLILNYTFNILIGSIILWYKFKPRNP